MEHRPKKEPRKTLWKGTRTGRALQYEGLGATCSNIEGRQLAPMGRRGAQDMKARVLTLQSSTSLKVIHDYRDYSPLAKWKASVPKYVEEIIIIMSTC